MTTKHFAIPQNNEEDVITILRELATHLDLRLDEVATKQDIHRVEDRLDRIEFRMTGQEQRIEILEDRMLQLATHVGIHFAK